MKELELIIFDMDGVLIDSEKFYMKSELQVVESFGYEANQDYLRSFCGTTQDHIWGTIKKDFNLTISLEDLKVKAKKQLLYLFETEEVELISGIAEILPKLKQAGFKLAVASSSEKEIIKKHLEALRILDYFDLIKSSEEVANSKPAPDVFLATAQELGILPSNTLVIEDSTNGIRAAKSANMCCVGFNNPDYPQIDQSMADMILSDMSLVTPVFVKELHRR